MRFFACLRDSLRDLCVLLCLAWTYAFSPSRLPQCIFLRAVKTHFAGHFAADQPGERERACLRPSKAHVACGRDREGGVVFGAIQSVLRREVSDHQNYDIGYAVALGMRAVAATKRTATPQLINALPHLERLGSFLQSLLPVTDYAGHCDGNLI